MVIAECIFVDSSNGFTHHPAFSRVCFEIQCVESFNFFPTKQLFAYKKTCPNRNIPKRKPTTVNVPLIQNFVNQNVKKSKPNMG
jgi:hypothetical protein